MSGQRRNKWKWHSQNRRNRSIARERRNGNTTTQKKTINKMATRKELGEDERRRSVDDSALY